MCCQLKKGLEISRVDDIELVGATLETARVVFKGSILQNIEEFAPPNVRIVIGDACYSCLSNLGYFLKQHRSKLEDLGPVTFVVGSSTATVDQKRGGRVVYYGNCAGQGMYGGGFVPGCVPRSRRQVFEALGIVDRYESYEW